MMLKKFALILIIALSLTACSAAGTPTGSASDSNSAQSVLPDLADYQEIETTNIQDALTTAGIGSSLATGNPIAAGAITRLDQIMDCYQNVGAVSARVYVKALPPVAGAVAVINEDRLQRNLLACAVNPDGARALSVDICSGSGRFTYQGDSFTYIYGGTDASLCDSVVAHFTGLDGR